VAKKKLPPGFDNQNKAVNQYEERRSYKNISIYVTELPATLPHLRRCYIHLLGYTFFQTECSQLKITMFHVEGFLVGDTIRVVVDTIIAPGPIQVQIEVSSATLLGIQD
jgi:hypothetical protein